MRETRRAIRAILEPFAAEGREWFRNDPNANQQFFRQGDRKRFRIREVSELANAELREEFSADGQEIFLLKPPKTERRSMLVFAIAWVLREGEQELRFYLGLWAKRGEQFEFSGYRFETPEMGEDHNYYHCQPCQNIGDRDEHIEEAVQVSQKFPTIPLKANDPIELVVCALMAVIGRQKLKDFHRKLMQNAQNRADGLLIAAFHNVLEDNA